MKTLIDMLRVFPFFLMSIPVAVCVLPLILGYALGLSLYFIFGSALLVPLNAFKRRRLRLGSDDLNNREYLPVTRLGGVIDARPIPFLRKV